MARCPKKCLIAKFISKNTMSILVGVILLAILLGMIEARHFLAMLP